METKAHYALVGFFAITLIAAAALFTVWLGQLRFDQTYKEFDVVFQGPVRGLTASSEVRFSGIQVGEVTRLRLDPSNPSMVIARIRILEETPITRDSVAQLEPQGLTGVNYIQLNPGSPDSEPLVPRPGEVPRLSSRPAQLESLLASSEGIAQAASEALAKINTLLTPENMENVSVIVANVRRMSDELAGDRPDALIPMARSLLASVDQAARDVSTVSANTNTLMTTDVATMVRETTQASIEVNRAAKDAADIVENAQGPVLRFANEGLDDLTLALDDLRRVLAEIEAIAASVEDNPAAFVQGGRRREVEIPQ
jgi:phospholipid/cholesterol/gamma-HCH transport system substrate-binding protein